jgi:hypothetical protein
MANPKTRTYTGVFYPGEGVVPLVPLIQHMKTVGLPGIISPIHSADGEEGKPHVHFMVDYPNPVRMETVLDDYGVVSANRYMEPVRSRKAMMRYFLHLDDEDKEQNLNPEDVLTVCGAIFDPSQDLTADDVLRILIEMQDYCDDQGIVEYSDLCRMVRASEKFDWFRIATSHTIHFSAYFRSLRHKATQP